MADDCLTNHEFEHALAGATRALRALHLTPNDVDTLAIEAAGRALLTARRQPVRSFRGLAAKIARCLAVDSLRSKLALPRTSGNPAALETHAIRVFGVDSGLCNVTVDLLKDWLREAFPSLKPTDVELLMLRHWHGFSVHQVAEKLGWQLDKARRHLAAAKKMCIQSKARTTR